MEINIDFFYKIRKIIRQITFQVQIVKISFNLVFKATYHRFNLWNDHFTNKFFHQMLYFK